MSDPAQRFADDVRYVRSVLDQPAGAPTSIFVLWAFIGAAGFALVDLAPTAVPWFWLVAGPAGGGVSAWLGWRDAATRGDLDRATGTRWMWHWAGFLAAVAAVVLLGVAGVLAFSVINPLVVVLLAAAYFLAGVHLDRRLHAIAGALVLALPLALWLPRFGWLTTGILVGAVTLLTAFRPRQPSHD